MMKSINLSMEHESERKKERNVSDLTFITIQAADSIINQANYESGYRFTDHGDGLLFVKD